MPSMLNPASPLCGLRFGNKPLLDLHVPENHRQCVPRPQNGDRDPGSTRAPGSRADSPPDRHDPAATPSRTSEKATVRPARGGRRAGQAMTALRRALRALRHVNGELQHAPGTVIRLVRAPHPRPHAPMPPGGKPRNAQRRTAAQQADCADCPICRVSFPL